MKLKPGDLVLHTHGNNLALGLCQVEIELEHDSDAVTLVVVGPSENRSVDKTRIVQVYRPTKTT